MHYIEYRERLNLSTIEYSRNERFFSALKTAHIEMKSKIQ